MAKVKITGHASGTGTITLTAPNTSTDRTITLPDGDISLGVGIDDNATSTAITIDSSENVGIGTASPNGVLNVVQASNTSALLRLRNNSADTSTADGMIFTIDNASSPVGSIEMVSGGSDAKLAFRTNGAERMRIDSSGHVGIGYAAVNGILDVRESWASKWAGRFENTSTTGLGILGITAATDGLYNLLELRKNTTEVVLKIRADGKAKSQFTAAGWVSIDGVGTVGINDSYNISSITDNGVGLYTINIDTNMLNGDYCVTAMCQGSGYSSAFACLHGAMSAGSFPIRVRTGTDAAYIDADEVMLTIFGDQ
jgi:hypothetical protein